MARVNRKEQRQLKREIRSMTYRAKQGSGEKETARRVSQMVSETLKADNGVERVFEELEDFLVEHFERHDAKKEHTR